MITETLPSIRAFLETIAMQRDRVLWSLHVDGVRLNAAYSSVPLRSFERVNGSTISFEELGRHLIQSGRTQLKELQGFVDYTTAAVLINSWPSALRLWRECQPGLREPLFALRALQELRGVSFLSLRLDNIPLSTHLVELNQIHTELGLLFLKCTPSQEEENLLALSNLLELRLRPWLGKLERYFNELQDRETNA